MPKPIHEYQPVYIEPMLWIPGQGPDRARLHLLMNTFAKPSEPLGEAWFMGKTRWMFDDLNTHGLEGTSNKNLKKYVYELLAGLSCFPKVQGWSQWYGYLAPRLLAAGQFQNFEWFSSLCQGLMLLCLHSPDDEVTCYEAEFATVLIPGIMASQFWQRGKFVPLHTKSGWPDRWGVIDVDADISVSLFMAWRYLPPEALGSWLISVMAIKDALWRAHLIVWLVRIWPLFEHGAATASIFSNNKLKLADLWSDPYQLFNAANHHWALVPTGNISALRAAIRQEFKARIYFEWIEQLSARTDFWPQMELWLSQFQEKYL